MKNPCKIRRDLPVGSFVVAAMLASAAAWEGAQESPTPKASEIDRIFSWATPESPGCAIAVSLHGDLVVNRSYGSADLERHVPITPDTIFDSGSLTKQFIAAAVFLLVEDGELSLSDDIHKYVPELPDYDHTITIDHLLTHTSGIRDWTGILPLTAGNEDALTLILRQRGLNFTPGEEWSYSNSGFVLAREIVARASGMPFDEFSRKRLFEPLGMKSTAFCSDIQAVSGERALAYDREGDRWTPAMMLDRHRGGGGVFSTAADLITWTNAIANNRLGPFVTEKLLEPTKLNNGRKLEFGRGLILGSYRGARQVWYTGSAEGYKSYLGHFPEHGLSIAIMCNSGDGTDRTGFAHRIFDLFVPEARAAGQEPESGPPPAIPEDALPDVTRKTGLFFNERTGEPLPLAVERGRFRVAAGPGLVQIGTDRFRRWGAAGQFMSGDKFELHFQSEDEFELKSMEGETTLYRRAKPYAPTADELMAFGGRFESDEIGTVFQVHAGEGGLMLRLEHAPEQSLPLKPVAPDTFQFSRITVRFARDEAQRVIGFDFSNPAVRNIRFTRL